MFESKTYEALLESALARVPSSIDKREGSMVMNGVAPSMAELAQLYIGLDFISRASHILTAPREYLILHAQDRGMAPYPASAAVFRAVFNIKVPKGARFSCADLNFVVTGRTSHTTDTESRYSHTVVCETTGAAVNSYSGPLIPVEYMDGLVLAELVELLVPGADEEETEAFRERILNSFQAQAFGGNRSDYIEKTHAIAGVGGVKVHPVWNGDTSPSNFVPNAEVVSWYETSVEALSAPVANWLTAVYTAALNRKLAVGGTVKLVILAANNRAPSKSLLNEIQNAVDPIQNAGEGLGFAPIGHVVNVMGATEVPVNISLYLTYASGWNWGSVKNYVEEVIDEYFDELAQNWETTDRLTVRVSQIENRILDQCSSMLVDIGGTKINGAEKNLVLDADSIPVRGTVSG